MEQGVAVRSRTQWREDANLAVASTLHRKGGGAKPNAAVVLFFQPFRSSTQQKRGSALLMRWSRRQDERERPRRVSSSTCRA